MMTFEELVQALRNGNFDDRFNAACALGKLGPDAAAAVMALAAACKDKHSAVRAIAAEALGSIGPAAKDAVPALKKALKDEEVSVRFFAAEALGRIGPVAASAVPALAEATDPAKEEDVPVRAAARMALRKIVGK